MIVGIELPGTGFHPGAWRRPDSRAEDLFTARFWVEAITAADRAGVDIVFVPDSFALQDGGDGVERGRLDAVAITARAAARTTRVALVPQLPVTHTEPFHISKAVASLDFATAGRAGWEVTVSEGAAQAKLFGRKHAQGQVRLWHEAAEAVEVVRRLWDSWEDDAEIRDVPTGRFVDRSKLHYIDFSGDNFSVKGPSITPRSPQGQPVVVVHATGEPATALAVEQADIARISAPSVRAAAESRARIRSRAARAGRTEPPRVLLDIDVYLGASAGADVRQLDGWAPAPHSETLRHVGTSAALIELLDKLGEHDAADGVVLRPLATFPVLTGLPQLGQRPPGASLRARLGLDRPVNRFQSV